MTDIERVIGGMERISLLAQLRDKVTIARAVGQRECGNCYFWMRSRDCPRERNVNGMSRGPASGDPVCGKFQVEQRAVALRSQRFEEARKFAEEYGLPLPPAL